MTFLGIFHSTDIIQQYEYNDYSNISISFSLVLRNNIHMTISFVDFKRMLFQQRYFLLKPQEGQFNKHLFSKIRPFLK
jgi:hypothetical protein